MRSPEIAWLLDQEIAVTVRVMCAEVSGSFAAVEHERAIRLVADHGDFRPAQHGFEPFQRPRGIHNARRVIG